MAEVGPFRSGAQARVQLYLLRLVQQNPGKTYAEYGQLRGRSAATTGQIMRQWWDTGWIKPDRELPAHWTITAEGEKVLRDYGHLLGDD